MFLIGIYGFGSAKLESKIELKMNVNNIYPLIYVKYSNSGIILENKANRVTKG